jgi:hypothetical protein
MKPNPQSQPPRDTTLDEQGNQRSKSHGLKALKRAGEALGQCIQALHESESAFEWFAPALHFSTPLKIHLQAALPALRFLYTEMEKRAQEDERARATTHQNHATENHALKTPTR